MTSEFYFESDLVVHYLRESLDYEDIQASGMFNGELLMIPERVKEFFLKTQAQQCRDIIRKDFAGKEADFWNSLFSELSSFLYESNYNIAIQLHPKRHSEFKFLGQYTFVLFYSYDRKEEDSNSYQVIRQITHKIGKGSTSLVVKPDIGIFINGFLFACIELKLQHRGQSAQREGRGQTVGNYREAVLVLNDLMGTNATDTEAKLLRAKTLKLYHGLTHHVAMDMSEAYVLRGINSYCSAMEAELAKSRAGGEHTVAEMIEAFRIEPTYIKEEMLTVEQKMRRVLDNLYSHAQIQNEILYYNFKRYDNYSVQKDGKKAEARRGNTPTLGHPRPNQKYGVDKVIADVRNKYENEHDPDFELRRLEQKLIAVGLSTKQREDILNKRKAYKNNRQQYSQLLQYAAGFGKTNIICWIALQLKDMLNISQVGDQKKDYLFDKIILLTDRVELRDQVDLAMRNMNIENELFKEANTTAELNKYLSAYSPRIIIVNIQKFSFLSDMAEARKKLLKNKRVAIIIDEIHRSNSGKQHTEMTSLFDEVAAAAADDGDDNVKKKNLIIGLTATPTDENLIRFGEYQGCMEDIKWMPLDAYTMREAIDDGFVMDPTKSVVPYAIEHILDETDEADVRLPSNEDYYESDSEYIRPVAKRIAKILLSTTYRKISGRAKAMLACYSITAARRFYTAITEEIKRLTQQKEYEHYADTKVYMVYSQNQEDTPAWTICGSTGEKEVISSFKRDKNGLMIVVDKLQTGFDEPRLHTLFLCKEVRGINAVQTLCRVNRVFKNKDDTMVVDFSINNRNIVNIREAFDKYAHVVVSETDTYRIKENVETMYRKILDSTPYKNHYILYTTETAAQIIAKTQEYVDRMLLNEHSRKILTTDAELYMNYLQQTGLIENVIGLDAKYTEPTLIRMLSDYLNQVRQKLKTSVNGRYEECVEFWLEKIGTIDSHHIEDPELVAKKHKDKKLADKVGTGSSLLDQILELNLEADAKELLIEDYKLKLEQLFLKMKEQDESSDERLVIRIKDMQYGHTSDEIRESFQKLFRSVKRRLRSMEGMPEFLAEVEGHLTLAESDFVEYVRK